MSTEFLATAILKQWVLLQWPAVIVHAAAAVTTYLENAALTFSFLSAGYADGSLQPTEVVREVCRRIESDRDRIKNVWLDRRSIDDLDAAARDLERRRDAGEQLPLFGLPFAVKDNIDVAGVPTTAACTAFARVPVADAKVVSRLISAGAIYVGKTNLDQLATGLVGVRSPYGIPTNPFDAAMIPGGSSSGSAVAVAAGHVSFSLGTDTAGSGRVPAAFNNIVGLKPSRGILSTTGLVPACRSLDCVSVFALTVHDARAVAEIAKGYDETDPFSRTSANTMSFYAGSLPTEFRVGVPAGRDLDFFGDDEARRCFERAIQHLATLGGRAVEVDWSPFREAAKLLYDGPWVAERLITGESLLRDHPKALHPILRDILSEATNVKAVDAFRGLYRIEELRRVAARTWDVVDVLVVPTAPSIYTVEQVQAEPRRLNTQLGLYTNFVNLLDLAALAVPAGFRSDRLPCGITFIGPHSSDSALAKLGETFHRSIGVTLGATGKSYEAFVTEPPRTSDRAGASMTTIPLAVVGAHLSGLPLNYQLQKAGASLLRTCKTAPNYRLYALPGTTPPKPGMVRVAGRNEGAAIEVEVWAVPEATLGRFMANVPPPLCIGTVALEDGTSVHGFLCESDAVQNAEDISEHGGWRRYLRSRA